MKNDPFSKLGAIDQKLFQPSSQGQEPSRVDEKPANPQAYLPTKPQEGKTSSSLARKPASGLTRKPAIEKPEKYTTRLIASMIKQVKVYAAQHEIKDYEVIERALVEYFERNK
jgi:hypothetical protein